MNAMDRGLAALTAGAPPIVTGAATVEARAYSAMWSASVVGLLGGLAALPIGGVMALAGSPKGKTVAKVGAVAAGVSSIPWIGLMVMWSRKN